MAAPDFTMLTHWGRATHICVGNLTIIGSNNGLSPGRRQAIIWTNDGILLIRPLGTKFSEISIEILTFSFKKMRLKLSSAKWRPFCLGLNVLIVDQFPQHRKQMSELHFTDVTCAAWRLRSPTTRVIVQRFVQRSKKHQRPTLLALSDGNPPLTILVAKSELQLHILWQGGLFALLAQFVMEIQRSPIDSLSNADHRCFICCQHELTIEQTGQCQWLKRHDAHVMSL